VSVSEGWLANCELKLSTGHQTQWQWETLTRPARLSRQSESAVCLPQRARGGCEAPRAQTASP
jgi:hypothetical protein